MQFSLAAEISRQNSTESGRSAISARSPVSVSVAQASTDLKRGISSVRRNVPPFANEPWRRRQR
jgi:hypothetical protein